MTGVLVTGAGGFLGRRLVEVLRRASVEVTATARTPAEGGVAADLSSTEATRRLIAQAAPDAVVHLAGGQTRSPEVFAVNLLPTVHLLDAVSELAPAARVLLTGSAAEYGEGGGTPVPESAACAPVNDYGRAKLAQTMLARAVAAERGLDLRVVRPFNVVASDLPATSPLGNVRRQLLADAGPRRTVVCGRTDVRRDFVAADDVAQALADLLERWPEDAVLNVCSGQGVSVGEVVDGLADALGVAVDLVPDPVLMALPAAASVVGDATALGRAGVRLDGSVARIVRALGVQDPN